MSIAQRADGRWLVKYKDTEGRWKQRSFRTEAEARTFAGESDYDNIENTRLTLLECVAAYVKNRGLSSKVVDRFEFLVRGHVCKNGRRTEGPAQCLASKFCDELTRRDLETVRENCRARGQKPSGINVSVGYLSAAMNWAVQEDMLHENPWRKYRSLPGRPKSMQGTLEDLLKLWPELPAWLQWAARTALALCVRPGIAELFSLRWQAFRWKEGAVSVDMGKTAATKTVYPPEDYLAEAALRWEAAGKDPLKRVCPDRRGLAVREPQYRSAWREACIRAGVRMPMYALRHIAASQMLAAGADLAAVAAQLGHRDLTTTGKYYAHALPKAQMQAGKALSLVRLGAGSRPQDER